MKHWPHLTPRRRPGTPRRLSITALAWVSLASTLAPVCRPVLAQVQPMGTVTAFVDVTVIPMDRERVLPGQTVLVQGGRILALGPVARVRVPAAAERIDGREKYLIPGLGDMHIHLGANHGDSASAERALFALLAHGVTTVRNMDYRTKGMGIMGLDSAFLLRLRARAAAGALPSPRIYTSSPWGPWHYIDAWQEKNASTPPVLDSVAAYVAAYKAAGYDFVKIHDESPAVAEAVVAAARRVGIPVVGHVKSPLENVLGGYTSIEHIYHYDRSMTDTTSAPVDTARIRDIAVKTRRAGVWTCPTLVAYGSDKWPSVTVRQRSVRELQAAGAGILSGTDACASGDIAEPGPSLHQELAALVQAGLTPYQALTTSTRNVAAYFGTLKESGTVAVGKRADLVLLDGNPLVDIHQTTRIAGVMHDGRWFSREALETHMASQHAAQNPSASTR